MIKFGFGVWLAMVLMGIINIVAAWVRFLAKVNFALQCCGILVITIVQTVYLGLYRFKWYGKLCSEDG